jgi:hypothetical protein
MAAIRLGTAANVRNFQVLLDAPSTTDQALDRESLRDEFGRLRVWSGNLGALQKGHSSLDYRLRDSPLLSSNVLKLLQELEQNLSEGTFLHPPRDRYLTGKQLRLSLALDFPTNSSRNQNMPTLMMRLTTFSARMKTMRTARVAGRERSLECASRRFGILLTTYTN